MKRHKPLSRNPLLRCKPTLICVNSQHRDPHILIIVQRHKPDLTKAKFIDGPFALVVIKDLRLIKVQMNQTDVGWISEGGTYKLTFPGIQPENTNHPTDLFRKSRPRDGPTGGILHADTVLLV
jgi:hypothetical protein